MRSRPLLAILLIASVFVAACKKKPATPPDVVVRVGDRMLTLADYKRYLERNAGTDLAQLTGEVASAMLDQYVEEIIVSEYAAAHGVEVPAEKIAEAVRNAGGATVVEKRDEMRRARLIANLSAEVTEPSDEQVRTYYEQRQSEFRSGDEVRVRQILVHDETLANEILKKLKAGADFGELSAAHSVAPNAKRGGEIGFVSRGELPKMFEEEIFNLQPAQISDVIRTDTSFHIFKVEERRAPGTIGLDAAAPVIRERLKEEAIQDRLDQLVSQSRRDLQVAVLTKRIPFRYSGTLPAVANE